MSVPRLALVALVVLSGMTLAGCGGGGSSPSAGPPAKTGSGPRQFTPGGPETVWIADTNGTLGTGGVTAYSVSITATALTPIPNDAVNESRPNLNSKAAGINAPQALALDARGNLWIGSQLSNLVVAVTPSTTGGVPVVQLPSGFVFAPGNPITAAFDASGNLWVSGGRTALYNAVYGAYSVAADLTTTPLTTTVPTVPAGPPSGLAFDTKGVLWTLNGNGFQSYTVSGGTATPSTFIATAGCIGFPVFDAANNLWCAAPGPTYDTPTVYEYSNPGGVQLASFPIPKPASIDVSYSYTAELRFDLGGTLWALTSGSRPSGMGFGIPDYAAIIALAPNGTPLTTLPLANGNEFFPDFIFAP